MNPKIDQYKAKSKFIASDNYYHYRNEEENAAMLAFKYDDENAFLVECPNSHDLQHFADLLEVKESNFLYISHHSNLLYAVRKDKSYYVVTLFTEVTTKECMITNKNSVKIIAERFLEDSLFDGRANEKRYLKEENWYDYKAPQAVEHPLKGQSLRNIGEITPPLDLLSIDTAPQTHLKSPISYLNELLNEHMYREIADRAFVVDARSAYPLKFKSLDIQQIETILDCTISNFYRLKNTILIPYPITDIHKKKLAQLPYSYRFITEKKWNIRLATENEAFGNYFIVIEWVCQGQSFFFDVSGYHPDLFIKLYEHLHRLDRLSIGMARPIRQGEQTAKSISIDYSIEEQRFATSMGDHFDKTELLEFLEEWVD